MKPHGLVFIASGDRYAAEAREAAAVARRSNPTTPICLIADHVPPSPFWDDFVELPEPDFSFRDKLALRLSPYERFIYLDTDAHAIGCLDEIFELLDRFDFAGHQLFEGHDCPMLGIPDAFPEFQGGVLAFKRSPAVEAFFARWLELYDFCRASNRDGHYHYSNVSDQKTLRVALYESDLRLAVLGPEFDFIPHWVNFACGPVRIVHTRSGHTETASLINERLGHRAWIPELSAVISSGMSASAWRRVWWGATRQLLRIAARKFTPRGIRTVFRQNKLIRRAFLGRTEP